MAIKRILGFDCSSSTIGYCLLQLDEETKEIKFLSVSYLKPMKLDKGTIIERLADTRDKLAVIINELRPDEVSIEDIIVFMPHRSSANTIITLAIFNRMLGLLSFDYTGKSPAMYPVMAMRRALQLGKTVPQKEEMPEIVAKHLKIKFPYVLNKKGKLIEENMDMADSCVVALFHAMVLTGQAVISSPVSKKSKPRKKKIKRIKKRR